MAFIAQHIQRTHMIHLQAPPSRVFPLFEPLPEREWAEGWEPTMLYPPSGAAEVGAVFTSELNTIWTISAYDQASFHITYVRVSPGSRLGLLDIQCKDNQDGTTSATITHTFTALSEAGNAFLEKYTLEHYQHSLVQWEHAFNHYLQHGKRLKHH